MTGEIYLDLLSNKSVFFCNIEMYVNFIKLFVISI